MENITVNIPTLEPDLYANSNVMSNVMSNTNVLSNTMSNTMSNTISNVLSSYKKTDNSAEFKYICIKKEFFDVNMIYLNYTEVKKDKYIEIIYKSPSIFLEGLFFKTPPLNASQIRLVYESAAIQVDIGYGDFNSIGL
jgi:hypothetical protein